jgi:hypothetical protein
MRRFLVQLSFFWLIQALLFAALFHFSSRQSDEYLAATLDKEHRLATLAGSRVVLVGGSNLAFGLDCAVIERHTGRPPINMGVYAGFGLLFLLEEARAGLRPGDVVVLAPEYYPYTSEEHLTGEVMDWPVLFRVNPLACRYAPRGKSGLLLSIMADRIWGLALVVGKGGLSGISSMIHGGIPLPLVDSDYTRHNFTKAGDLAKFRERKPNMAPLQRHLAPRNPDVTARAAESMEEFVAWCRQHDIAVYLAMPVFPRPDYEQQAGVLQEVEAMLRQRVSAPMIVSGREATLPEDRFYDTCYHLTTRGVAERSELLGQRLAQALRRAGK